MELIAIGCYRSRWQKCVKKKVLQGYALRFWDNPKLRKFVNWWMLETERLCLRNHQFNACHEFSFSKKMQGSDENWLLIWSRRGVSLVIYIAIKSQPFGKQFFHFIAFVKLRWSVRKQRYQRSQSAVFHHSDFCVSCANCYVSWITRSFIFCLISLQ